MSRSPRATVKAATWSARLITGFGRTSLPKCLVRSGLEQAWGRASAPTPVRDEVGVTVVRYRESRGKHRLPPRCRPKYAELGASDRADTAGSEEGGDRGDAFGPPERQIPTS